MRFLKLIVPVAFFIVFLSNNTAEKYKCLPCGQKCDAEIYNAPGKCEHCKMDLVKASTITFGTVKPSSVCDYIESHPKTILLDVRTKEEFEGKGNPDFGSLKNAVNIPIQELTDRLSEIEKYKNHEIIVYCSHSHRSPQASYLLSQYGFKKVKNMSGGMSTLTDNSCKK